MPGIEGGGDRFREARELLERGAVERAYQAAVLLLARKEEILLHESAGEAHLSSIFDISSLTKPLVASFFYLLVQQGRISPGGKVSEILPARSPDPAFPGITFLHLLSHTSGLPSYRPFYREVREAEEKEGRKMWGIAEGHDRIVGALLSLPLESPPGTACVYSDLGFILLGRAMEAASFMTLDRLLRRELSGPLGMRDTAYLPLLALSECETVRLISTGHSEERGRETVGEVDDENAAAMGGVAGHAGVFSTAHDLFLFAREILRARRGEGRVLSRRMAEEMTTKVAAPPGCPRTPGWDTPTPGSPGGSQAGRHFPEGSVGHLGWTGCSLWIDLSREITCVLLTNRVYYGQQNQGLTTLRPRIHDAVMEALDQE
ncbi:MAG TPA: serine hydrolase domain-containing protein [Candidatus Deferrimicrobiaceae bacterium]|nr:serine hydrolase domain-containing protein [Candidatus Deferrimicrobiaceae bacterium]